MSQTKRFVDMIESGLGTAAFFPKMRERPYCVDNKRLCVFDMLGTELSHKKQKNALNIVSLVSCCDQVFHNLLGASMSFDIAVDWLEK